MSNYNVFKIVDYITASVINFAPIDDMLGSPIKRNPTIGNYKECIQYDCGLIVQWDKQNPRMKTHITASGTTLAIMREYGFTDIDILSWICGMNGSKIGRIDLAVTSSRVDSSKHRLMPKKLFKVAKTGTLESNLDLDKPVVDVDLNVETCYLGNRKTRNRLFRAYDYNLAHKTGEPDYVARYELESRKSAYNVAKRVIAGQDYGGIVRSVVDFPDNKIWCEIMDSEPLPNVREDNQLTRFEQMIKDNETRWEWLLKSVAPALGRAIAIDTVNGVHSPIQAFDAIVSKYARETIEELKNLDNS